MPASVVYFRHVDVFCDVLVEGQLGSLVADAEGRGALVHLHHGARGEPEGVEPVETGVVLGFYVCDPSPIPWLKVVQAHHHCRGHGPSRVATASRGDGLPVGASGGVTQQGADGLLCFR